MHVIVTGACGFIGSHVCEALLARGDTVCGVDNFNDFYDPAIKEGHRVLLEQHTGFSLVRGSILDDDTLTRAFAQRIDVVVHLAAWAGVRPSIDRPALYQRENIEGTVRVMDHARAQQPPPRFVFASSSSVYGGQEKVPFHEDDPVMEPVSPYAATKRAGELLLFTYSHLFSLFSTSLRFFTVYGPRQRPEMAIHLFAKKILDGAPIPMFGDGSTERDYTYIDDITAGVLAAVDRTEGPAFRIYNLGNSRTVRLDELIRELSRALRTDAIVEKRAEQPGDVPRTYADISRARAELGYDPKTPIDKGLKAFAAWLLHTRSRESSSLAS